MIALLIILGILFTLVGLLLTFMIGVSGEYWGANNKFVALAHKGIVNPLLRLPTILTLIAGAPFCVAALFLFEKNQTETTTQNNLPPETMI
jgi:hypothetical protein